MNHVSFLWFMFGFLSCLCVWIGVTIWKADPNTETGLGSGRSVSDDFIAVVDGYWFRDGISDWKERRGTVYDQNAGITGVEDARKEE